MSALDTDKTITDSIGGLLASAGGLARIRRLQKTPGGFDAPLWAKLAEDGWLGGAVPEAQGGSGLSLREIVLVLETAGKTLMPEPLPLALAASHILAASGKTGDALLRSLLAGHTLVALAAENDYVADAHAAATIIVRNVSGPHSTCLALPAASVIAERFETIDGGTLARISLKEAAANEAVALIDGFKALTLFDEALDRLRLYYAALLVGLAGEALRITVAFLKERKQFGAPLGSFQALQHRAASLYVAIKASRALLFEACHAFGTAKRRAAALAAKAHAAETALATVKECVQFHGAMGYTEEHDIGLFFRRAVALAAAGGDPATCRRLFYPQIVELRR